MWIRYVYTFDPVVSMMTHHIAASEHQMEKPKGVHYADMVQADSLELGLAQLQQRLPDELIRGCQDKIDLPARLPQISEGLTKDQPSSRGIKWTYWHSEGEPTLIREYRV